MSNIFYLVFFGFMTVVTISGVICETYKEDKKTIRYEICVKYHTPKECK